MNFLVLSAQNKNSSVLWMCQRPIEITAICKMPASPPFLQPERPSYSLSGPAESCLQTHIFRPRHYNVPTSSSSACLLTFTIAPSSPSLTVRVKQFGCHHPSGSALTVCSSEPGVLSAARSMSPVSRGEQIRPVRARVWPNSIIMCETFGWSLVAHRWTHWTVLSGLFWPAPGIISPFLSLIFHLFHCELSSGFPFCVFIFFLGSSKISDHSQTIETHKTYLIQTQTFICAEQSYEVLYADETGWKHCESWGN